MCQDKVYHRVKSMVKTSRTAPSKRPVPGRVFRKCRCYVLEPTDSSLSSGNPEMKGGSYKPATPVPTTPPPISNSHTSHTRIEISPFRPPTAITKGEKPKYPGEKQTFNEVIFHKNHSHHVHPPCCGQETKAPRARNSPHGPPGPSKEQAGEVHQQGASLRFFQYLGHHHPPALRAS